MAEIQYKTQPVSKEVYESIIRIEIPTFSNGTPQDPNSLKNIRSLSHEHCWSIHVTNSEGGGTFYGGESVPELDSALDVVNYALADYGIRDYIQGLNLIGVRITSIGLENYHRILELISKLN